MKKLIFTFVLLLVSICGICQKGVPQRNLIYVLDCTASMRGYNGAPDIWNDTKNFLKTELEKEQKNNSDARIVLLPFQEKVLTPINIDPRNLSWNNHEATLERYISNLTATNICDSWLAAEKFIDQSCENYIVLMTDGHDNIGGSANEAARMERLAEILSQFCGKYANTKGIYVELTKSATLPGTIRNVIDVCDNLHVVDASEGIPSFGCVANDRILINTRDLPVDIELGFSNSGKFAATVDDDNEYVKATIKDGYIDKGRCTLVIESKFGDNIEKLNRAIGKDEELVDLTVKSDEVNIINPEVELVLRTLPARSLTLNVDSVARAEKIKPFLWIKGNAQDTLRWYLAPKFNEHALANGAAVKFKLEPKLKPERYTVLVDNVELDSDSSFVITPESTGIIELVVPRETGDVEVSFQLKEVDNRNLDRLNGTRPDFVSYNLKGETTTLMSWLEIAVYVLLGLIILGLLAWFGFIKSMKYPTFRKGTVTINDPYFANIMVKGYRMIVFTSDTKKQQGFLNRLFTGPILYHPNSAWPCEATLTPSGHANMRFNCRGGRLISDPIPTWMPGENYSIIDSQTGKKIIELSIIN